MPVVLGNALVNILFGATIKDFIPEDKAALVCIVGLIPLYFLTKKRVDVKDPEEVAEVK